jgi:hypothetical protein
MNWVDQNKQTIRNAQNEIAGLPVLEKKIALANALGCKLRLLTTVNEDANHCCPDWSRA